MFMLLTTYLGNFFAFSLLLNKLLKGAVSSALLKLDDSLFQNSSSMHSLNIPWYPKLITLIFQSLPRPDGHCYSKSIL